MTASYNYITDTGTVVADTQSLLQDVQAEWQLALGANLDLDASTPQGTLIAAETIARSSVMKNNADLANTINPNLSYGTFLDAICALLGIGRGKNTSTIGTGVTLSGNNLTTIQAGSRVQTSNGDIFFIQASVTIAGGTASAILQSQAYGNIPLPLGALTIIDGTIGWGDATVTSGTTVVPGTISLTDPKLKTKRNQQLALQGVGSSAAILAAIYDVPNVTSANVVENNTGSPGVINGVTFSLGSAMWVCVAGGASNAQIAQALYGAHNGGCPWDYGTSSGVPVNSPNGVSTTDPSNGLTYNVKWTTPVMYDCYVHITVHQNNSVSSPAPSVQNAIISYTSGQEDGEPGLVVGADVSAFEMGGAVSRQLPGMYVKDCSVACVLAGSPAPTYPGGYSSEVVMAPFQQAVLQIGNITVVQI
jgi:hypothetical protein